jgi:DNA-binding CsgD family transcriptional regulator
MGGLEPNSLLFDLQQANEIALACSGCLEPEKIARTVTEGLVVRFNCAFVRLWLLEPGQTVLKLVASAGMYTHTDGQFARVPLGAYKVGKIAQNRVAFLSNNLAAEPWVGNRAWAIEHQIRGFAGYPLAVANRVIGVLAVFSHGELGAEFLEILQTLCSMGTIALDAALQYQQEKQAWQMAGPEEIALSDRLVRIFTTTRLMLVGTEIPLVASTTYAFLKVAEVLAGLNCAYGRLVYGEGLVTLEAIVPNHSLPQGDPMGRLSQLIGPLGNLQLTASPMGIQVMLSVSYQPMASTLSEREIEILQRLTQGDRDRDIADRLIISESTVKFHINNALGKLNARTRYQGIYQAIVNGWL